MADKRMIDRAIFESSVMHKLSATFPDAELEAQRIFEVMILMADDYGRGRLIFQNIKMKAFGSCPNRYEKVSLSDVETWVNQIASQGAIVLYEKGEERYYALTGWERYQSGKWYRRTSNLPEPPVDLIPSESRQSVEVSRETVEQEKRSQEKKIEAKKEPEKIDIEGKKELIALCRELVPAKCSSPSQLMKQVDALDKLFRIDQEKIDIERLYSPEEWKAEVIAVLRFAKSDTEPRGASGFCWATNFQSIARVRDNGCDKYINMRSQYLASKRSSKTKRDDSDKFSSTGKVQL